MSVSRQSAIVNVMIKAAEKAAKGLLRDFGEVEHLQVSRKGPSDFVSNADLKAEKTISEELRKARPKFGFVMEEAGRIEAEDGEHYWIIDPLDGTSNFLHGLPHWAISIALERKGELLAGVVYDPVKDEKFWAEKGVGAFVNSRRLRVSARSKLEDAIIATGVPARGYGEHKEFLSEVETVMGAVAGVRRWGAASLDLAYVAAGRYEGFWERKLNAWDVAAGMLLIKEAGGYVSEINGGKKPIENKNILAANEKLHGQLVTLLATPEKKKQAG